MDHNQTPCSAQQHLCQSPSLQAQSDPITATTAVPRCRAGIEWADGGCEWSITVPCEDNETHNRVFNFVAAAHGWFCIRNKIRKQITSSSSCGSNALQIGRMSFCAPDIDSNGLTNDGISVCVGVWMIMPVCVCVLSFVCIRVHVSFTGDQSRLSTQAFSHNPVITAHYLVQTPAAFQPTFSSWVHTLLFLSQRTRSLPITSIYSNVYIYVQERG